MWRKNLYSNTGYEDNYTDVTFLQQLRRNINQRSVTLDEALLLAGRLTEQLCVVVLFIGLFLLLFDDLYKPETLFIHTSLTATMCYVIYIRNQKTVDYRALLSSHGKTVMIFLLLGYILSPILKTLTSSISTDTIYATTFFVMLLHLTFCDYKVNVTVVSNALSTNAAIFGSLCLASRLSSSQHAFVLLTISVECFVLYPSFISSVRKELTIKFLVLCVSTTTALLAVASFQLSVTFILLVIFLNGLCPFLYVRWQRYKNNLYGPWDEAVISEQEFSG